MDPYDYGKAMDGIARLAIAGAAAMVALFIVIVVGTLALGWWAWKHVEVRVVEPQAPTVEDRP
jgi:hypothetical protein